MTMIGNIHASEDQSMYIGQVYQEEYASLRNYFLTQLGDESVADDCAQKTLQQLFFFMEDRDWEAEAKYITVYIWRIAGFLCSRKLCEKRSQRANRVNDYGNKSVFNKVRVGMRSVIKEGKAFTRASLRLLEGDSKQTVDIQRFKPTSVI
jgi:DNA-directed RNA polymerase specialized sigma24 family protein